MNRLRAITLLLVAGLFFAVAGATAMASVTGTSAPSDETVTVQSGDDGRHCC
jgi:hypothetical protein